MIGIYIICYLIFPIAVLMQIKRADGIVLLDKGDIDVVKGIATCFVMLAHIINELKIREGDINPLLDIFTVMGGMGVLLFFFVSGYGIYKGYNEKKPSLDFWIKRLTKMYIPCVLIQFSFCLIDSWQISTLGIGNILYRSFWGAWFIDVIIIEYFIFFISWVLTKKRKNLLVSLSFGLSIVTALIFLVLGFNARWYNGLLLFPVGMLFAWKEREICLFIDRKWMRCLMLSCAVFALLGGGFIYWKENVWATFLKIAAGICLSLLICIIYRKIKVSSTIMAFIGRRSLYFYLIHLGWLSLFCKRWEMSFTFAIYIIILLTFLEVEIIYRIYNKCRK